MTSVLAFADLLAACRPGGASVLTSVTQLEPAGGAHSAVAPPRYLSGRTAVYAYETRYINGEPQEVVLLDSKASALNRMEAGLAGAIYADHPILARLPRIQVSYDGGRLRATDLEIPHRAFDGHIRAGRIADISVSADERYRALRDCSPSNAMPLLITSPVSLAFGAWDSTRKSHQARFASPIRGEIVGVLADQGREVRTAKRGGARSDAIAPSVQLSVTDATTLFEAQKADLGPGLIKKIEDDLAKARKTGHRVSASRLGLGSVPPTLETLGLVACRQIIRTHVLSFATLRQLRFGAGPDGDAACRALLAALALNGLARADSELHLRADCHLRELAMPEVVLDQRYGQIRELSALDIDTADALLEQALAVAESAAGVQWQGQVLDVIGNPLVSANSVDDGASSDE